MSYQLLFEYAPRVNGRPLALPIALQCFDRYVSKFPDWGTEAVQVRAARAAYNTGCDTHWLDAAWFDHPRSAEYLRARKNQILIT